MDEFYLPEEIVEWLGLKKSEYLSKLIVNIGPEDIQFEEYMRFDEFLPQTLSLPDWSVDAIEDGQRVKTFCRSFAGPEVFQQVVIGAMIADQNKNDVFVPILTFVTRSESLVMLFSSGNIPRRLLN
jgi:hypothetical protein